MRGVGLGAVLAVVLGLGLGAGQARSAGIETAISPEMAEMGCTLRLSGPLAGGDLDRLEAAAAQVPPPAWEDPKADLAVFLRNFAPAVDFGEPFFTHRLCLDSDGGDLWEAIRIAEYMQTQAARGLTGWPTAIARGDRCAGACAVVFFAGRFVRFPGIAHYDGPNAANALLNPAGVLDLGGLVPPGEGALRAGADVLGLVATGALVLDPDLLARAMRHGPDEPLVIETVAQAVRWGIEVEPNLLHLGASPGTDAEIALNLCRNAALRAPPLVRLVDWGGTDWEDLLSGRAFACTPGAGFPAGLRALLNLPPDPGAPRPRLRHACSLAVEFRLTPACDGFACEVAIPVELPCLAAYPPETPLRDLAVPLAGR